ncbi:sugar transferase [Agromyces intestinalis]|uniref:Sugar transferase n=1 Tax=Agromyces intestinalis TaxID=2592652 RepID=A0A5C1YFZ4_9MICO|nr:sugar transferase [Agromyces intestinalis]QEO15044.1 sugar transferase [Agromyces intestinalis]
MTTIGTGDARVDATSLGLVGRRGDAIVDSAPVASGPSWAQRYRVLLIITDVAVVLGAVGLGLFVSLPAPRTAAVPPAASAAAAIGLVAVWLAMLAVLHSRDIRALGIGATEYKRVVNATLLAFGAAAILCAIAIVPAVRSFLLVSLPVGTVALVAGRWLWRKWLGARATEGHFLSRAIVVGGADDVRYVIEQIAETGGPLFSVEGVALDPEPDGSTRGTMMVGGRLIPVIGDLDDAAVAAARIGADAVIVAGQPARGGAYIRSLAWSLEPCGAELVLSSRLADVAGPRIHLRPVQGLPLIHVETPRFEGGKHVLKRTFDIVASGLGLIAISGLLAVIAIAVRLDGPGPVLFRQRRIGRNGETFEMLKFRSMVPDAEERLAELTAHDEGNGVLFKIKDDPRITRVGRFLRHHSLDELPQLWNVLRGEMSLVGPRPPLPAEVAAYTSDVHRRLFTKPGLTGLWQVSGRSDLTWEESVRLDLYYVENWSLTGDLMLIWRTLKVVLRPSGAY